MALNLITQRIVDASAVISHTFSLDRIGDALKTASDPSQSLKVIVTP
jgi:threonine dehydrogenase-like Zn-dependent dehydrogenase